MSIEAMKQALEALNFHNLGRKHVPQKSAKALSDLHLAIADAERQEHAERMSLKGWQYFECPACGSEGAKAFPKQEKQEPVAWKWHQAPVKTLWGHDMVVADLAIDKDNTVSVYCERDQTTKVEAMFSTPPQRTWVVLTDEEKGFCAAPTYVETVARIEAKLKQKNGYAEEKNAICSPFMISELWRLQK